MQAKLIPVHFLTSHMAISDGTLPGWLAGSCSGCSDIAETSKDSKPLDIVMFVPT